MNLSCISYSCCFPSSWVLGLSFHTNVTWCHHMVFKNKPHYHFQAGTSKVCKYKWASEWGLSQGNLGFPRPETRMRQRISNAQIWNLLSHSPSLPHVQIKSARSFWNHPNQMSLLLLKSSWWSSPWFWHSGQCCLLYCWNHFWERLAELGKR